MKVITVSSWDDFVRQTDTLDGWAFRGQREANWDMVSALARYLSLYCPDRSEWRAREERAIRIFRRKAHIYLREGGMLTDSLRCLAIMQHHGAPTRLLDFTKSPYVAALFALDRATQDSALFALNTPALWRAAPAFDPSLTREQIDPRLPGNFERYFAANAHPVLWFGEPDDMDRRLVAQSGLFVLPGLLDMSLREILSRYDPAETMCCKIVLPLHLRERAMHALYRMNITHATLFPDLDGLARSMAYELEVSWPGSVDDVSLRTNCSLA